MSFHIYIRGLFLALLTALVACQNQLQTPSFALASATASAQDLAELNQVVAPYLADPQFAAQVQKGGSLTLGNFALNSQQGMSDSAFIFGNTTYNGLKTKLTATGGLVHGFSALTPVFGSMNDLFAAHGIGSQITSEDINAYLKVAALGLRALNAGDPHLDAAQVAALTTADYAHALHLVLALAMIKLPTANASAGLSLDYGGGALNFCGAFNGSDDTANYNWFCLKDTVGGSVGYLASGNGQTWQDAFSKHSFPVCPSADLPDGGSWGWIPGSGGKAGQSCHTVTPLNQSETSMVCDAPTSAAWHSPSCPPKTTTGSASGTPSH